MDFEASTIAGWGKKFEFPLAALGFGMGVTEKNPGVNYANRTANFLSALGIGGVTIPGPNNTTYTSVSGQGPKFNPTGFLNKGFATAILLEGAKQVVGTGGPAGMIVKVAYDIGMPIAVGYAVGGILDPPSPGNPGATANTVYQGTGQLANFINGQGVLP